MSARATRLPSTTAHGRLARDTESAGGSGAHAPHATYVRMHAVRSCRTHFAAGMAAWAASALGGFGVAGWMGGVAGEGTVAAEVCLATGTYGGRSKTLHGYGHGASGS